MGLRYDGHQAHYSPVSSKKLPAARYFKIVNNTVPKALRRSATTEAETDAS